MCVEQNITAVEKLLMLDYCIALFLANSYASQLVLVRFRITLVVLL